jgi:pimeloyl-ACP methyl ester carboxylesterase
MKLLLLLSLAVSAAPAPKPAAPAAAKTAPAPKELDGTDVELKTPDGWTLTAKYQAAMPDQRTLVLIHGKGQRKEIWYYLTKALTKNGFGYIAPDLRGHGKSQTGPDGQPKNYKTFKTGGSDANEFAQIALDVQAAVEYLGGQGVAGENVGLIGTDLGSIIAIRYAAVHPTIPYVVMLSPAMQYQDVPSVNAIRKYVNRPLLMVYSELDKRAASNAAILYGFAKQAAGERNAMQVPVAKVHGVKLPANGPVIRQVIDWLILPVKPETPAVSTGTPEGEAAPVEGDPESSEEPQL